MKVPSIEPLEARIAPAVLTITPVESSTDEGNTPGSTTNVQFKITLDTAEAQDISVLATAFAGTAFIGEDLAAFAQTIIIPKGLTEFIFNVPVRQDRTIEADETFSVKLSSPSANAFLGPEGTETAIGTIKNDDKPTLTLETPAAVLEGSVNGGLTHLTFKIKLDQKSATPITLKANPADGTARADDNDYVDEDIIISIPAGVDEWTFTVPIRQDMKVEGTETFTVELFDVSDNAFLGTTKKATATITTDDLPTMRIEDATLLEGANGTTQMKFKVLLQGEAPENITFDWFTGASSATAGVDFTNIERTTATIVAGTKELELIVDVLGDTTDELDETFSTFIQFAKMGTETIQITDGQALGKIQNDDLSVTLGGPGTVTEQTAGENGPLATIANYTLTLSGTSNHAVTVELEIVDGTAKAGSDFTKPTSLTITIPANSVTPGMSTISVPITIDQIFEGDQTFQVRIKSVTNAIAAEVTEVTTTILDDEVKPTLSVVESTVTEGNTEREVQLTVSLSGRVEGPVTFDWSTLDGTALAGLDYEAVVNRTATIADGALTTNLVLKLLGDEVWESDEKLSIVLSNVSSNAILEPGEESGVITIDEREAVPTLTISDASAAENAGAMTFTVSMPNNTVASEDITFNWTAGLGTATSGVDYTASPTTVTIPAGQRSATFTVTLLDDAAMEADETFLVTIGNATFDSGGPNETAVPIGDNQATGRILNDERQVSISTGTLVIAEQNGAQGETASIVHYVINLTDGDGNLLASDRAVTVTIDIDALLGTAEANDIEFPNGRTVTIPAGSTSVGIDVRIRGDVVFEGDETLVMKVADVTNASIRDGSASTTITDEEGPVRFVVEDQKVAEGDVGIVVRKYKVKLNGPAEQDITFDWSTADGTAISGAGLDYTRTPSGTGKILAGQTEVEIDVVLSGDTSDEGDEHFFLNFSNVQMKDGTPVPLDDDAQAKVTIQNDEATVRLAGGSVVEGNDGEKFLVLDVSLLQASQHEVRLTFAVGAEGDLAELGFDYELPVPMTVTIPAGQTHATISIPLIEDSLSEANENVTVKLTDSENAFVEVGTATGTIVDDDVPPVLSINNVTMTEGDAGTKTFAFTITMDKVSGQDVKVLVTPTAGTATLGATEDFTGQARVVTIPAGQTTVDATFDVTVNGDTRYENDEAFTVVLSNATGATVSSQTGTGTGTITNDDPLPTLTIADIQVNPEGNTGTRVVQFTVSLSEASTLPVKFKLATADGLGDHAATKGSDYVERLAEEFTIPAGTKTMTYSVSVIGDSKWEGNETFRVVLTDAENAQSATGGNTVTATGLIIEDEAAPTLSVADLSVTEGANGTKEIEVLVTLSSILGRDLTFDWSLLTGSTATQGSDFNTVTPPGSITIPAGETTAKIKFTVNGDVENELTETFSVKIANALAGPDAVPIVKDTGIVTLQNDEISINVGDPVSITEGDNGTSVIEFKIVLSGAPIPTQGITVNYATQDGTARSTGEAGIKDFDATSGTLTFMPGEFEKSVLVTIYGDTNFDSIDQFKLLLSGAVNAAIVDGDATGTILDETTDTRPVISIVEEDHSRAENADAVDGNDETPANKTVFTYKIKLDRLSDEPVSVNFSTVAETEAGKAISGTDYTAVNRTITFAPGELEKTVTVDVLNDSLYEEVETFKVELKSPLNGTLGVVKEETGTIGKDDDIAPTLKVSGGTLVEGDAGSGERFMEFVVTRTGATGADLSFKFTPSTDAGDTAAAGVDYEALAQTITMTPSETSKVIKVKILGDADLEQDETFTVALSDEVGATIATEDRKAKGTILDDDIKVSIAPGTYSVSEGNAGQRDLVFNVELNGSSPFDKTITYTVTPGTATNTGGNPDYENPDVLSIVIPAGQTTGQIRIPVLGDTIAEDNETLTVTLTGATNAELAATNISATGTILNDDASLIIGDASIEEGDSGEKNLVFTVTLKDATAFPVTVHYVTSNGSATAGTTEGSDYTFTQGDLSFGVGGPTTLTISVPLRGDTTAEGHETFTVTLSGATGATILDATATGTILDDDNAHLSIGDATITEGDSGQDLLEFTVTLSGTHEQAVSVDYTTVDGSAKSVGPLLDYLAQNGTLTFAPGESTKTISIPILGDTWKELTENFTVKLSNARLGGSASAIAIDDDTATGQILDDGDSAIGFIVNHAKKAEGASGTSTMIFTIETTAPVTEEVTLKASARAGSAGAADFTEFTDQEIKIAAGSSTTTASVTIKGDTFFEDAEFFYLDVSDFEDQVVPVDGSTERVSAFGVILNDDINIINAREFQYIDKDGDLVHVKFSKGTLSVPTTGAGTSSNDVTFTLDDALGGRTIQLINIADDGREFEGTNITITATPQILVTGEVLGTGKTSVGSIQSMILGESVFSITSGVGLGTVKIDGDLGSVVAGSFATINGIRRLEVDQFGSSESLNQSVVFGPLGRMIVHGDFLGSLAVVGDAADQPFPGGIGKIGSLVIDGALRGGSTAGSGQITVTHSIGSVTMGGLIGGTGGNSGLIFGLSADFNVSIGKVTILGDMVGGTGDNSGSILQVNKVGSVSIGKAGTGSKNIVGNLIGGGGAAAGTIGLNKLGSLFVNGDIKGGSKDGTGLVRGTTLSSARIEGDIIGGGGAESGRINFVEFGSLSVNGDIQGGAGVNSGSVQATKTLGTTRVAGDVIGGGGEAAGAIIAGVLSGKLTVEGSVLGGAGASSGIVAVSGYTENFATVDGKAGNITIGKAGDAESGDIRGGDGDNSGRVFVNGNLNNFVAYGNLEATWVEEGEGEEEDTTVVAKGAHVGGLEVVGTLAKAVIKGSILGGMTEITSVTNRQTGSGFVVANEIGSLTIEGRVKSGVKDPESTATLSNAFSAGIHANGTIKTLKILGDDGAPALEGNKDVPVAITAGVRMGDVTIGGDVKYAEILAGYNRTTDLTKARGVFVNAGATIDSVTVEGKWTASNLVAGVYAGVDGQFGTTDDTGKSNGTSGTVANQDLVSRIASVIIQSTIEPVPDDAPTDASYAIVAEYLKSVRVNGIVKPLNAGSHNDQRVTTPLPSKTQIFEIALEPVG